VYSRGVLAGDVSTVQAPIIARGTRSDGELRVRSDRVLKLSVRILGAAVGARRWNLFFA
jgi:hypothetical protein